MLFVNEENVSHKEFIKIFGLSKLLGITDEELENPNFKFKLKKPNKFLFNDNIVKPDPFKVSGDKKAATRFFPINYIAKDIDGDTVSVAFSKTYPTVNKDGSKKFQRNIVKWKFEHIIYPGEEDIFLFLLLNPECQTSPCADRRLEYYHLENKELLVSDKVARYNKRKECEEYISKLTGASLIIKALGISNMSKELLRANKIVEEEGEDSLRLRLADLAAKNPFAFADAMFGEISSSTTISGKIKFAINTNVIKKTPTNMPNVNVWQFEDGTEIVRTNSSQNDEVFVQDALTGTPALYNRLENKIREKMDDVSERVLSLSHTTSEKINLLIDAELLHYDLKEKAVYWVDNGEVIEPPILKVKKYWKEELVKFFDNNKNKEYFEAKVKLLEAIH